MAPIAKEVLALLQPTKHSKSISSKFSLKDMVVHSGVRVGVEIRFVAMSRYLRLMDIKEEKWTLLFSPA
jgi:hypothetical protein